MAGTSQYMEIDRAEQSFWCGEEIPKANGAIKVEIREMKDAHGEKPGEGRDSRWGATGTPGQPERRAGWAWGAGCGSIRGDYWKMRPAAASLASFC